MNESGTVARLYPLLVVAADIGVGVVLYEKGLVVLAAILWLAVLSMCLGAVGSKSWMTSKLC